MDEKIFFKELATYPIKLTDFYEFRCPCGSKKVYVSNQKSKTKPGFLCHVIICVECGKNTGLMSLNPCIEPIDVN